MTPSGEGDSGRRRALASCLGNEEEVKMTLRRTHDGWEAVIESPPGEEWARVWSKDRQRCLDEASHYTHVA